MYSLLTQIILNVEKLKNMYLAAWSQFNEMIVIESKHKQPEDGQNQ